MYNQVCFTLSDGFVKKIFTKKSDFRLNITSFVKLLVNKITFFWKKILLFYFFAVITMFDKALVAQLDRASDYGSEG